MVKHSGHLLEVDRLAKKYRNRWVVKALTLQVRSGEIIGLLGANGAGKTTSFYMIAGLASASRGDVKLDGQSITKLPIHKRSRLGISYLPQEASIFRKLTVAQNILGILELGEFTKKQRHDKLEGLLQEFNLESIRDTLGVKLSGGERRRVEIARALCLDPKFILLDEPFAGIDPLSIADLKELIHYLITRGVGVLITDHNVRETLDICDRAYIVHQGCVIAEGNAKALLADKRVRKVYLGDAFNSTIL